MNADAKKTVLRMIPYGIYVLTADDGKGNIAAATVNWVTQTAFAPPLVVVGVKTDSGAYQIVKNAEDLCPQHAGQGAARASPSPSSSRPTLADGKISGQAYPQGHDRRADPRRRAGRGRVQGHQHRRAGRPPHRRRRGRSRRICPSPIAGRPDAAILEMKDLGDNVFYGGWLELIPFGRHRLALGARHSSGAIKGCLHAPPHDASLGVARPQRKSVEAFRDPSGISSRIPPAWDA